MKPPPARGANPFVGWVSQLPVVGVSSKRKVSQMSRKLQHISTQDLVDVAERDGKKVKALCGARHYPMQNMKESIPTCTPCANVVREECNELALRIPPTYTYTFTNFVKSAFGATGGAA